MAKRPSTARQWQSAVGLAGLLCGLVFYLWARSPQANVVLPSVVVTSFPSFIHMLVLISLAFAIGIGRQAVIARSVTLLFVVTVTAECLIGYTDVSDVLAIVLGTITGIALGIWIQVTCPGKPALESVACQSIESVACQSNEARRQRHGRLALVGLSLAMISGSYYSPYYDDGYHGSTKNPIYLSYSDLRSSVAVTDAIELQSIGRLYLFGNHVFLNRRNEGIHVIDNSDPRDPVNVSFITIPGNTEISIRSGFLYADSYVDLVTLDIRDINNIQEINRQTDIFPWDAYQNIPDDIHLTSLDSTRGVVTSYVR